MGMALRNKLFFMIVFFMIFSQIPNIIQLNFIGAFLGKDLSIYPILFSFLYYAWKIKKEKTSLQVNDNTTKIFVCYIGLYVIVVFISFIHGLIIYPYYDAILEGPVDQIEKLPAVYQILQGIGILISEKALLEFWMFARLIKGFIIESFWFFSVPLLIYSWFRKDAHTGITILHKAVIWACIVVCLYGLLDIAYLSGSTVAESILTYLNPLVHDIKSEGTWWPPLLWKGQLRSLFAEPSYYGIFMAFAMPWIWYSLLKIERRKKKVAFSLLLFAVLFELFLTKARTANALLIGELILLVFFTIWYRNKSFVKNTVLIAIITLFSFTLATFSIGCMPGSPSSTGSMGYDEVSIDEMGSYLQDNLGSLSSSTQRSNRSRYSILQTSIAIGKDYPIFGVGKGLRNAYIPDYLPVEALAGNEIQGWIHDQKEKGILRSGFPALGEYYTRFAETGILGLLVYLLPSFYLFVQLLKRLKSTAVSLDQKEETIFFLLSWMGIMASGLGDNLSVTCCYWILIGIGYALILPDKSGSFIKINGNRE